MNNLLLKQTVLQFQNFGQIGCVRESSSCTGSEAYLYKFSSFLVYAESTEQAINKRNSVAALASWNMHPFVVAPNILAKSSRDRNARDSSRYFHCIHCRIGLIDVWFHLCDGAKSLR